METVKDFRVGNYIFDAECEPNYFQVEEIKKNEQGKLAVYYRNGSCMDTEPAPIPLTEDILVRLGFEQDIRGGIKFNHFTKGKVSVFFISGNTDEFQIALFGKLLPISFKDLHQLQNLAYDIGQELTLNP